MPPLPNDGALEFFLDRCQFIFAWLSRKAASNGEIRSIDPSNKIIFELYLVPILFVLSNAEGLGSLIQDLNNITPVQKCDFRSKHYGVGAHAYDACRHRGTTDALSLGGALRTGHP